MNSLCFRGNDNVLLHKYQYFPVMYLFSARLNEVKTQMKTKPQKPTKTLYFSSSNCLFWFRNISANSIYINVNAINQVAKIISARKQKI